MPPKQTSKLFAFCIILIAGVIFILSPARQPLDAANGRFEDSDFAPENGFGIANTGHDLPELVSDSLNRVILPLVGIIALFYLIYYGIMFASSQGEEGRLTKAKNGIMWAVLGIIVIGLSFYLIRASQGAATPEPGNATENL